MANFAASTSPTICQDPQIWQSLKVAIASSSGFQRWELEHLLDEQLEEFTLDHRVRRYLRETLETLAY